jgi:hypothetical protein
MKIHASRKIAIQTRYLGPTNFRGSRYKAYTESGRAITVSADYRLNSEENHRAAALALCAKMRWDADGDDLIEGGTKEGYVYIFLPGRTALVDQPERIAS